MSKCSSRCQRELTVKNWFPSFRKRNQRFCKQCWQESKLHTTSNGKDVYLYNIGKRPKPLNCKLCEKKVQRMHWHHWDDEHPEFGLWLCWFCHGSAERIDMNLLEKYLELRRRLGGVSS